MFRSLTIKDIFYNLNIVYRNTQMNFYAKEKGNIALVGIFVVGIIGATIFFYPSIKTISTKWSNAIVENLSNRLSGTSPVVKTPVSSSAPASAPTKQPQVQKVIGTSSATEPANTAPSPTPTPAPVNIQTKSSQNQQVTASTIPTPTPTPHPTNTTSTQEVNQGSTGAPPR